jgi:hypothetical protein
MPLRRTGAFYFIVMATAIGIGVSQYLIITQRRGEGDIVIVCVIIMELADLSSLCNSGYVPTLTM